ncbi:MAG: prolipoprotein diacylglyceryl transferase [Candidatus Koribacter versatilis]|uniref:Phosphatidylglycerol--prolipoprotein diacylglyceryl transferase n=1 Tax=Candidatus Korobacter versatilis TaxID=658062 RepID=A0A932ERW8_9BACT|nr:prolipoprotein diacylglyceryl transferase [Candidatus Koribacter versatilis]
MLPRLLDLGRISLPTYGVLSALGLILGLLICVKLAKREGIDPDRAWNLGILSIVAAVLGSKLMLLVTDWSGVTAELPGIFTRQTFSALLHGNTQDRHAAAALSLIQAGGVWYGGLLFGSLVAILYMWRHRLPVLKTFDAYAPGIAFGHIIGRIGCFAAGCCYGKPTDEPWGVTFTNPLAAYYSGTPLNVRIHPTQLYEAAANSVIFLVLLWLFRRKKFDGQVLGAYFFLYGVARYFLEFYRDDPERGSVFGGAMSVTQLIALCLVVTGGLLWLRRTAPQPVPATT